MLEVRNLTHVYTGTSEGIRDVSFSVPHEHIFAILGRSGAGKTTLLQCLGRFLAPQSGTMAIDGRDILSMEEKEFRRTMGIVFQRLFLFPHLSVLDNITLAPIRSHGSTQAAAEKDAADLLERFGIASLRDKYPAEISGGQAQRVALCRSMMLRPQYLLLDEPTAALDVRTTREFGEFLLDLKTDTTFVIVTHDTDFVERIATQGVLMEQGGVSQAGDVSEIVKAMKEEENVGQG